MCEICGSERFDAKGKAREFVVHFPLKKKLERLLQCEQYLQAVKWEGKRRSNASFMTGTIMRVLISYDISAGKFLENEQQTVVSFCRSFLADVIIVCVNV